MTTKYTEVPWGNITYNKTRAIICKLLKDTQVFLIDRDYISSNEILRNISKERMVQDYSLMFSQSEMFFDVGINAEVRLSGLYVTIGISLNVNRGMEAFLQHANKTGDKLPLDYIIDPVEITRNVGYMALGYYPDEINSTKTATSIGEVINQIFFHMKHLTNWGLAARAVQPYKEIASK